MSENCEHCGKEHHSSVMESFPEFMMLNKAIEEASEIDPHGLGPAVYAVSESMVEQNIERAMMFAQMEGKSPKEAVETFASVMVRLGFLVGILTSDFYKDKFGKVGLPSDEEVAAEMEKMEQARKEVDEKSNAIIEALRAAGVPLPENVDADSFKVMVGSMDEIRAAMQGQKSASDDDENGSDHRGPGLYL